MTGIKHENNAVSILASGITNVATSLTVSSGDGSKFPVLAANEYFYCYLVDTSNNYEIIKVTARAGDVFTIERAQQGTSGRAFVTSDAVQIRITKEDFPTKEGIQESAHNYTAAGGTVDAITAGYSPAIQVLTDGLELKFRASGDNVSTAPTFSPDGLIARAIAKKGGGALAAGDITGDHTIRYDLAGTQWELLNPANTELVADTSPQLGGDLDLNGNAIDFPSTPNISDVLDEDTMASDSATALATQQSIKAYVDTTTSALDHTDITLGTEQATTSGTSIDFTSIPSGTKRITIMFVGVSVSGTSSPIIQIGDSGGIETTGYLSTGSSFSTGGQAATGFTNGYGLGGSAAANVYHGSVILGLEDSSDFTWVASGVLNLSDTDASIFTSGSKSLTAELDRVRITTSGGANTFDAGVMNINYE